MSRSCMLVKTFLQMPSLCSDAGFCCSLFSLVVSQDAFFHASSKTEPSLMLRL